MDGSLLLRRGDRLATDSEIGRERFTDRVEDALLKIVRSCIEHDGFMTVSIDRKTGALRPFDDNGAVSAEIIDQILDAVAKAILIQVLKGTEHEELLSEFAVLEHARIMGTVRCLERASVIVSLGTALAVSPKEEQIPGEGLYILKDRRSRVRMMLSREKCRG